MKIDMNKKYQTRDGHPVELITINGREEYPVAGYIGTSNLIYTWTGGGKFSVYGGDAHVDLVEVPEEKVLYLNVYPEFFACVTHSTREGADKACHGRRTACVKVKFVEGQFDE